MPFRHGLVPLALALSSALVLGACGKQPEPAPPPPAQEPAAQPATATEAAAEPIAVAAVELGNAVGEDKKVTTPATEFAPGDTIYASVSTTGSSPHAVLQAIWTHEEGQAVNRSVQAIRTEGPATTSFHVSKEDGWPPGHYQVEILLNDQPVGTREFTVKEGN